MDYSVKNFTNIDSEDFVGVYDGKEEVIKAGETKPFASFLVDHYAKQLAKKIIIRKGGDFSEQGTIDALAKQIKGEVEVKEAEPVETEEPEAEKTEEPKEKEFSGKPKNSKPKNKKK